MASAVFLRKRNFLIAAFLFGMACCNLSPVFWVLPKLRKGYQDFAIYYVSGRLLREGRSAVLYNLDAQYKEQLTFADVPIRLGALPFNHPAFEAPIFVPLTFLGFWHAYLLWTTFNFILLAASVRLLRRFPGIRDVPLWLLALGVLAFFPLTNGLLQGQDAILFMFLAVAALTCLDRGADRAAGAWLGGCLFRPHMAVPLVLLLAAKRWRILFGFLPVALVLAALTVAVTGWRGPLDYLRFVLLVERGNSIKPEVVPNLRGLAGAVIGHFSQPAAAVLIAASSLAVLVFALRRIRNANDSASHSFCLASVTSILVGFHALSYELTLLLPLVLFLLAAAATDESRTPQRGRLLLLFLLFLTPLYVYLILDVERFFVFGLVILWLFLRLLRAPAPSPTPT